MAAYFLISSRFACYFPIPSFHATNETSANNSTILIHYNKCVTHIITWVCVCMRASVYAHCTHSIDRPASLSMTLCIIYIHRKKNNRMKEIWGIHTLTRASPYPVHTLEGNGKIVAQRARKPFESRKNNMFVCLHFQKKKKITKNSTVFVSAVWFNPYRSSLINRPSFFLP